MATSPRMSFKGYSFTVALYRNKDALKAIFAIVAGVNVVTGFDWKIFGLTIAGAASTFVGKMLLDAFDFFFGETTISTE